MHFIIKLGITHLFLNTFLKKGKPPDFRHLTLTETPGASHKKIHKALYEFLNSLKRHRAFISHSAVNLFQLFPLFFSKLFFNPFNAGIHDFLHFRMKGISQF